MIILLGDLHLNASKPYFIEVAENFLRWYKDWHLNNKDNEVIFVGDLVNTAINGGIVFTWLERLIQDSNFRHVHIVQGNHDYKKKDGVEQLAYDFYFHKPGVSVYTRKEEVEIEGKKVLMLPYYSTTIGEQPFSHYYSSLHMENKEYDIVVGHFADDTFPFGSDVVKNTKKIKTKHLCLGHIHTRVDRSTYIGSVYANKVNETEPYRAAWIIDEAGNRTEELLPVFCEFVSVKFPEPLPQSKSTFKVSIYSLYNCPSEQVAVAEYGPIHIRKVVRDIATFKSKDSEEFLQVDELNISELFTSFLKSNPINRKVASLCLSLL